MRHLFGFPRGTPNGIWLLVPGWCCGEAIGVSFTRQSSLGGEAEIRDFNSITKRPQGPITFRGRESWCMHTGLSWQIKFCGILSVLDELVMMVLSNLRRVTNEDVGTRSIKARSWQCGRKEAVWHTEFGYSVGHLMEGQNTDYRGAGGKHNSLCSYSTINNNYFKCKVII